MERSTNTPWIIRTTKPCSTGNGISARTPAKALNLVQIVDDGLRPFGVVRGVLKSQNAILIIRAIVAYLALNFLNQHSMEKHKDSLDKSGVLHITGEETVEELMEKLKNLPYGNADPEREQGFITYIREDDPDDESNS